MHREAAIQRLVKAEKHVFLGERAVVRQRALVATLERDGRNTTEAKRMLANFEAIHTHQIADRDMLRQKLEATAPTIRKS